MTYIFYLIFEDSTSCCDLTITLLNAHVKYFNNICKWFSTCGAPQASDVFQDFVTYGKANVWKNRNKDPLDIEKIQLHSGDTLIFIVDSTAGIRSSQIVDNTHIRGVRIFRTVYYCFESCLFSYRRFNSEIFGKLSDLSGFIAMQQAICNNSYPTLKDAEGYRSKYAKGSRQVTMEELATSLFSSYMQNMACVKINKHKHTPVKLRKGADAYRFYNNDCDFNCSYCKERRKLSQRQSNCCTLQNIDDTLYDFYLNSVWSTPLHCLYGDKDRALLDIFNDSAPLNIVKTNGVFYADTTSNFSTES